MAEELAAILYCKFSIAPNNILLAISTPKVALNRPKLPIFASHFKAAWAFRLGPGLLRLNFERPFEVYFLNLFMN